MLAYKEEYVRVVMEEIKRFRATVTDWRQRIEEDPTIFATKEGGAMRRASMDLSRALAEMRKG